MSKLSTYSAWVVTIAAVAGGLWLLRRGRNSTPTLVTNKDGETMRNYFADKEFTQSTTAKKYGINNEPDALTWQRIYELRDYILNPARAKLGKPIYITSGYRSDALNKLVGGENNSQHKSGEAADITTKNLARNRELFSILAQLGNFDQLIWEKGGDWIHVSFRYGGNRGQMLAYDGNGYKNINYDWQTAIA